MKEVKAERQDLPRARPEVSAFAVPQEETRRLGETARALVERFGKPFVPVNIVQGVR